MRKAAYSFLVVAALVHLAGPAGAQSDYATPYTFTTFAGAAGVLGSADGTGAASRFSSPSGVVVDASGNLYVADTGNSTIRKVTPAGVVTTIAGAAGITGIADGTGAGAQFKYPQGIAVDASGNLYVADTGNNTIRKVTPAGVVTTIAGTAGITGSANGTGPAAQFNSPLGVAVDASGNVFVADSFNYIIREITPAGVVTTPVGQVGNPFYYQAGQGNNAIIDTVASMAFDGSGNLYLAEPGAWTIEKMTPTFYVSTFAGSNPVTPGVPVAGSEDGTGVDNTTFGASYGIAIDGSGNVYVADTGNNLIRKITPAVVVTTLAGNAGVAGSADGTGAAALFNHPWGVAVDGSGNVYVTDSFNNTIRKGTFSGAPQVSTQPIDQYAAVGGSATFSVAASGSSTLSYQWNFNGSAISGATGSSYTVTNAQSSNAGSYTVTVTDTLGSVTSAAANLYVNPGSSGARLINISTRAQVGTGGNILIPGFVIGGSGTESLLIRADGPSLTGFGVAGALAQPILTVLSGQTVVASNTGWGTNPNPAQIASVAAQVGAFPLASGSADCALLLNLAPGAYTVQVSGVGNTTGVALAEVYEVSSSGTRLINIATRAQVGTGSNIMIAGFVVSGSGSEELLVRGDGPSLTGFGVAGALVQPSLSVLSGTTVLSSNTAWGTYSTPAEIASVAAQVGAFALASGSADSAVIVSLPAGAYTAQVSGVGNTTGVGLAELYEVP